MRAKNFGAQFVSSLALLGLLAGICAERDGNQRALEGHISLVEQRPIDRDVMYDPDLTKAEINSLLSTNDELHRSTTSAKTTCEFLESLDRGNQN